MRIVKLDAIDSTNDFLRKMTQSETVDNFTVVTARAQTHGRGQMGSSWVSEQGKNLTMSMLSRKDASNAASIFQYNAAVAIAITDVLKTLTVPALSVKWPNDIMSGNRKIGGILIENIFRSDGRIESITGVGLNVNQTNFEALPQASSLKLVTGKTFDVDALALEIAQSIVQRSDNPDQAWSEYLEILFRKGQPTAFELPDDSRFMAVITAVGQDGRLEVQFEDDSLKFFGIKEIKMLYQ